MTEEDHERLLALYARRVANYVDVEVEYGSRWRQWCRVLLSFGGSLVVPQPDPEPDLDALLADAVPFGPTARKMPGQVNQCHRNVALSWIDGAISSIGTGYALSDELWRQHSWGVDPDGTVVETTTIEREAYFGILVPAGPYSMQFAGSQAQDYLILALQRRDSRAEQLVGMVRELATLRRQGSLQAGASPDS